MSGESKRLGEGRVLSAMTRVVSSSSSLLSSILSGKGLRVKRREVSADEDEGVVEEIAAG